MAQWSHVDIQTPVNQIDYQFVSCPSSYQELPMPAPPPLVNYQEQTTPQAQPSTSQTPNLEINFGNYGNSSDMPVRENPREVRNRAEKLRRDRLNQSIAKLASFVPPVVAAQKKVDKTTVLRLTAHYLRANQHVFGESVGQAPREFTAASIMTTLRLFNGFLITVTYRGIIVVVSQNVQEYLGYTELDLVGQNLLNITHEADRILLRDQLMPRTQNLGLYGELLYPNEPGAQDAVDRALAGEKRNFVIRLKKLGQRSAPSQYTTFRVEGTMRRSDRASGDSNRSPQVVRRVRARTENPYASGNDIVFIAMVRPYTGNYINEAILEASRMEYRTRHTIDGLIIQCDSRISMVTGYMPHEVCGVNAMNFMHRDDVHWVIVALREMYDQQRIYGKSCYRLMTKNGQFIYMKTQGYLEVDKTTRVCTSFVCTNTVVDSKEGKHLIKLMREKYTVLVNKNTVLTLPSAEEEIKDEDNDQQKLPIVHPKQLEPDIFRMVVDLHSPPPSESEDENRSHSPVNIRMPSLPIAIIPPTREKIISGIDKMYELIKDLQYEPDLRFGERNGVKEGENLGRSSLVLDIPVASCSRKNKVVINCANHTNSPTNMFHCVQVSNTPSQGKIFPDEVEENEDVENDTTFPGDAPIDLSFLDDWTDYWTSISLLENQNIEYINDDGQAFEIRYHDILFFLLIIYIVYSLEELNLNAIMNVIQPEVNMNQVSGGIKRPSNSDVDMANKKKTSEVVSQTGTSVSCLQVPTIENHGDENSNNSQVVMDSSNTREPNLVDLMATLDDDEFSEYLQHLENDEDDDE